jgi:hypothetical protein
VFTCLLPSVQGFLQVLSPFEEQDVKDLDILNMPVLLESLSYSRTDQRDRYVQCVELSDFRSLVSKKEYRKVSSLDPIRHREEDRSSYVSVPLAVQSPATSLGRA